MSSGPPKSGTAFKRAKAAFKKGRFAEAERLCIGLVEASPRNAEALRLLASAQYRLGHREAALASYQRAIALDPDDAETLLQCARVLLDLARFKDALATCDAFLALRPDSVEAHISRGIILKELRRFPEALASFAKAQELAPDDAEAHFQEAIVRLLTGDLLNGFAKYEWRQRRASFSAPAFDKPQWDGLASLYGRTILLYGEGRLSDTIQFCQYIPLVAARGARIVLQVPRSLRGLMTSLEGVAELVEEGETVSGFDLHCPLNSLPFAFGTKIETIPSSMPYLRPRGSALLAWESRLPARTRLRIGIAWAGDPRHEGDSRRSLELRTLAPLFELGATFVSLQKELPPRDQAVFPTYGIVDPTAAINDFVDTAALIAQLDLVIAVDTSVAHLAGAMAKTVWILLPHTPDWRWLLGRNTSTWYPTARLFRQAAPGDWDEVTGRVAAELEVLVARSGTGRAPE
jgi:hypothetical protein